MSDPFVTSPTAQPARHSRRGQSLVEFALILPMLLVLLLGVADFGRVFAAGITVEAAARNAAEVAAQEYLRNPPGEPDLSIPAPTPPDPAYDPAYYEKLHSLAARTACRESRDLANTTYIADDPGTPVNDEGCTSASGAIPLIRVCVHDNADPFCGRVEFGETIPAVSPCTELISDPSNTMEGGSESSRYVEVRICYRFTTLINIDEMRLPFGWDISVGEVYLQKDRAFTVGWYPPRPTPSPPPAPTPPPPTEAPTESPSPTPSPSPTGTPEPTGPPTPTPVATPSPTPCPPPVASFTATPISGKRPLTVNFLNTSTSGCAILTYLWNFGDGTTSPGQNPTHIFTFNGNGPEVFNVTFTVTNQSGTSAPATAQITVTK